MKKINTNKTKQIQRNGCRKTKYGETCNMQSVNLSVLRAARRYQMGGTFGGNGVGQRGRSR